MRTNDGVKIIDRNSSHGNVTRADFGIHKRIFVFLKSGLLVKKLHQCLASGSINIKIVTGTTTNSFAAMKIRERVVQFKICRNQVSEIKIF